MFHAFSVVCLLFTKLTFSKKKFRNTIRVSKGLDPDKNGRYVGPDLGPSCLGREQADFLRRVTTSKEFPKGLNNGMSDVVMTGIKCPGK